MTIILYYLQIYSEDSLADEIQDKYNFITFNLLSLNINLHSLIKPEVRHLLV